MTTDDKRQATCAERLPAALAGRVEDFRSLVGWRDAWGQTDRYGRLEDAQRRIDEYPLAVSVSYSVRVELSTGGPADYLVAEVAPDGDIRTVTYHFADWWDHAAQVLDGADRDAAVAYIEATMDLSDLGAYVR